MNLFFSCDKSYSSRKNIILNNSNSSVNENEKRNKEKQLLSANSNNEQTDNLEIIEYPYSTDINDNTTIKMNSTYKNQRTINKTKEIINAVNSSQLMTKKQKENKRYFDFNLFKNSSNNSSAIINNDDNIPGNKMMLHNYYINDNIINNINSNSMDLQKDTKNVSNKPNKSAKKNKDKLIKIKIKYPRLTRDNCNYKKKCNIFNSSLSNTDLVKNKLSKKIKKNWKNNKFNKTIEIERVKKEKHNYKLLKTLETNDSEVRNLSKNTSKAYDTFHIYINKSYNNIKENKLLKGKIKTIMKKKVEKQKTAIIKRKKALNKNKILTIKKQNTVQSLSGLNKMKSSQYFTNTVKIKPLITSKSNCISSLLHRNNKNLISKRNTIIIKSNKIIINPKAITRIDSKKSTKKKIYKNPFIIEDNTFTKTSYW